MKTCSKCKVTKDYSSYAIRKQAKDGLKSQCKECQNSRQRELYKQDPEKFRQKSIDWMRNNPEKTKEIIKKAKQKYYSSEKGKLKKKQLQAKNREKHRIHQKQWSQNNKERITEHKRKHYLKNKEKIKAKQRVRRRDKYHTDTLYRLRHILRALTRHAFKKQGVNRKARPNTKTMQLLGCEWAVAKQHIESLFKEGMTWQNQGEWEIDHIRPISSFDLNIEEDVINCFNYKNLQPLWANDNRSKGNKINISNDEALVPS